MKQDLTTRTTSSHVAPAVDLPLARELAARLSGMVGGAICGDLPAFVRTQFERRWVVLMDACRPAERSDLEEVVAGLMMRYPSMRGVSQIEAQVMTRAFADDLAGVPLWAIKAAIAAIARGAVPDVSPDFAPSAPRLRQLAQEHLERPAREMLDLKKVLTARIEAPSDPEMRERVRQKFAELKREMPRRESSIYAKPADLAPQSQAMSVDQLMEHYAKNGLGFAPKRKAEDAA